MKIGDEIIWNGKKKKVVKVDNVPTFRDGKLYLFQCEFVDVPLIGEGLGE